MFVVVSVLNDCDLSSAEGADFQGSPLLGDLDPFATAQKCDDLEIRRIGSVNRTNGASKRAVRELD
jgi:hypothetical protein